MMRMIKISGNSLEPLLSSGDYALVRTTPLPRIRPQDIVVFRHPDYGLLIKQVQRITDSGDLFVQGLRPHSVDSRSFGAVPRASVFGKVVWSIRRRG